MSKILNSVTLLIICTRGHRKLIPWRKSLCSLALTLFFFLLKSQTIFLPSSALSLKADVAATPFYSFANPSVSITDGNGNDLPNASICPGSSITLYANTSGDQPISFSWTSIPTGFTSTDQSITVDPTTTTAYTVTVTDANGLTASDDITVTVNSLPAVDLINDVSYCNGDAATAINLSGPINGTGFSWVSSIDVGFGTNGNGNIGAFTATNNGVTPVTSTITVTPTANGCTGTPTTFTITVYPPATVNSITNQTYCAGVVAPITNLSGPVTGTSFTWTNSNTAIGLAANGSGNIPSFTATNATTSLTTATITITPSANGCTGPPITFTITVYPTTTVNSITNQIYCAGVIAPITNLSGPVSGTTFTWANNNTSIGLVPSGSGDIPSFTATNATTSPITATITVTPSANGCTGTPTTFTITVYPTTTVNSITNQTYCAGVVAPLTSLSGPVSGTTFTWANDNTSIGLAPSGSGNIPSFTATNATTSPITATITVTPSANACAGAPTTFTITVYPTATVNSITNQTYCAGVVAPITNLSGPVSGSTFTWTNSNTAIGLAANGSGNVPSFTATNATTSPITATITVTPSANGCTGTSETFTVTVNPAPTVITAATKTICSVAGTNIALTASVASTFTWTIGTITGGITGTSAGSGSTINQTLTNPSNTTAGTVQYIVTPTSTSGSCPGTPFTITVTVNPKPVVTTANTATTCSGTSPNINLTASAPSTFTWTIGTVTGGITGASAGSGSSINQTLNNPSGTTAGTIQYIVTPTSTAGSCPGTPLTITVTVNPAPTVTTAATKTICSGTGTNITLTANAASTFTWTIGTITGGITGTSAGSGSAINQTLTNPSNTTAGTVQYVATPTSTSNSCPGTPFTITVTVNPKPVVTTANIATTCSGTGPNVNLTASAPSTFTWTIGTITGGITGASAGSGSSINQTLNNPSGTAAGTIQYIVTPTSTGGSCPGTPLTITVTVNPAPTVTTAATKTICSGTGTNITLTANAASTFTWTIGTITGGITGTGAGSGSAINQTLTNPSSTTAGTVQYIVTPTSTVNSCPGTAFTITVTVNPAPTVTTAATTTICSGTGTNIALTASVASTFTWTIGTITGGITGTSAGSGSTINQTLTNPSNTTAGTVQYVVTPTSTSNSCPGTPFTITVTVNPKPAVTTANTATTCSGTGPNINLTASAPSTFTWTIGTVTGGITGASAGSGSTINQILNNPSGTTAGTIQYIVTPTSTAGSCAGTPLTITVTVNPAPTVTTAAIKTICSGAGTNITLTANAASTFTWTIGTITGGITGTSAGSGSIIDQTLTNPSSTTTGTVQYIVTPTATANSCPGTPVTITVTVNPTPTVTTAATKTICSGAGTSVALTASVASTFTWTIGTITGGITGASAGSGSTINQTLTNPSNTTAGTVQYIVTPTSTSGSCPGIPFTITVTVNPKPVLTTANTATTCSGTGPNINLTASAPSTFTWTIGTVTGGITGASAGSGSTINQTLNNPSGTTAGTIQYIVTPTSTTGSCPGTPLTITVTVNPAPTVTTAATKTICSGAGTNITLTANAASTFTWTIGTITGGITGANAGSGSTINQTLTNPSSTTAGTIQYIVTPTSTANSCPGAPYTITTTVNPAPAVTVSPSNPAAFCSGGAVQLTASGANTYSWSPATDLSIATGAIVNAHPVVTTTYTVTGTAANGCINTTNVTVSVTPTPSGTLSSDPPVCPGNNSGTLTLSNYTGTIVRWESSTDGGVIWTTINNTNTSYSYSNLNTTTIYRVLLTLNNGCDGYSTIGVVPVNPPFTPTATATPPIICLGQSAVLHASDYGPPPFPLEDFQNANPAGWSGNNANNNNKDDNSAWGEAKDKSFNGLFYSSNAPPTSSKYMTVNGDGGGSTATLTAPPFSLVGLTNPILNYYTALNFGVGTVAYVQISTDGGATFTTLKTYTGPTNVGNPNQGWVQQSINLSAYIGSPDVTVRFVYSSPANGSNWAIDNVGMTGTYQPVTYQWSPTTDLTPSSGAGQNVTTTPTVTGTINYCVVATTAAGCASNPVCVDVLVKPLPVVSTVNSCIGGGAVTFSQSGGATGGTWTVSGGGTITSAGVFIPTAPGCFTATYTTPSPFCPDNENFVVFPVPVLTSPANTCGSAFTLPAVTPVAGFTIEYSIDGNTTWSPSPTIPTTPGCHTIQARYILTANCGSTPVSTPSSCLSNVVSVVIFPAAPVLSAPANTCASAFTLPTVTAVAGFNVEFSVDGGTYSYSPTIPTVPGCHTIQARYVLGAACGNTTTAAAGPCLSNIVSVVIFPAAPVISAPGNACASIFTLPTVTAVTGFTVQYSIDGGSYSASPTIITPGCHTIQAQYVLISNCGVTTAGTTGIDPCGTSNIVSALIFPAAPGAPVVTPGCDAFTVTPPPPVSGFNIEYSFDGGVTWGANTPPTAENCTGYKIKTRYVTAADCGSTLAGTPGSAACGESPVTTRKVDYTKPDVICPVVSPVCQVAGDSYTIPSLTASDNCSPVASLIITYVISGTTTRSGSGVDASGIFNGGLSTITWTVIDECGNANTCTTQVTIYPKLTPIIYHN